MGVWVLWIRYIFHWIFVYLLFSIFAILWINVYTAGSSAGHQLIYNPFFTCAFDHLSEELSLLRFPPIFHVTAMINFLIFFSHCFQSVFCYIYTHHVYCIINFCIRLCAFHSINIKCLNQDPFPSLSISTESNTERENNRRRAQQPRNQSRGGNPEGSLGSFDQDCHGLDVCRHSSSNCPVCDFGVQSSKSFHIPVLDLSH